MPLPRRLKNSPLVEATCEVRFTSNPDIPVELLPGLVFPTLGARFPHIERLNSLTLPEQILKQHPDLDYAALFRFRGDNATLLAGQRMLAVSTSGQYPGWEGFRALCVEVINALRNTKFIRSVDRYSLRYMNLLPAQPKDPLDDFQIRLDVGVPISPGGFRLRFERNSGPFVTVVECASSVEIKLLDGHMDTGILFSIDTIRHVDVGRFLEAIEDHLDNAHSVAEPLFFGLLKPETIQRMKPVE